MVDVNTTIQVCSDISVPNMVHGSLFTAICIIVTLAFLEKRRIRCLNTCDGRPGVVVSMNLLDDFDNRWSYACSFGAMLNAIATLWVAGDSAFKNVDSTYTKVLLSLVYTIEVCVAYFPLFACLKTKFKFIGAVLGGLYTFAWFTVVLVVTVECTIADVFPAQVLALQIPAIVCLGVTTGKFVTVSYEQAKQGLYTVPVEEKTKIMEPFQHDYVKFLFNKSKMKEEANPNGYCNKIKLLFQTYFYEKQPNFKFSARIVCTMFLAVLITYQFAMLSMFFTSYLNQLLTDWAESIYNETLHDKTVTLCNTTLADDTKTLKLLYGLLEAGFYFFSIITLLLLTLDLLVILAKYRTNLLQLHKGDYSFMPKDYNKSSSNIMRYAMVFPGYQIAYKMWGFFFLVLIGWFFLILLVLFIVIAALGCAGVFGFLAALIIIPVAMSLVLRYGEQALCYFFFLQAKILEDDEDKPLAVRNRNLYHIADYFFFLVNIPLGIFSSLMRIGRSLLWGLIFLGRVDRCVLPPGFESMDAGYQSYLGMLLVENAHNHPVLRVFCQHLVWSQKFKSITGINSSFINVNYSSHAQVAANLQELNSLPSGGAEKSRQLESISRSKIRWHLYITLANNPHLIPLRKRHLVHNPDKTRQNTLKTKIMNVIKTGVLGVGSSDSKQGGHDTTGSYLVQEIVAKQLQERQEGNSPIKHANDVSDTPSQKDANSKKAFENELYMSNDYNSQSRFSAWGHIDDEPVYSNISKNKY